MANSTPEHPDDAAPRASRWPRIATGAGAREKVGQTMVAVDRARRQVLAHLRRSQLAQWPSGGKAPDELLLAPPDLRVPDPSFAAELAGGDAGPVGEVPAFGGVSPFLQRPADEEWMRELHGFGWLRHLEAVRSEETEALAQRLLRDWLQSGRRDRVHAWAADVTGRRLASWLAHSAMLLDRTDRRFFGAVMHSIGQQAGYLSAAWQEAPEGHPRLVALMGLVLTDLCVAGRERELARSEKLLAGEIERQVLPDGGHISRNAETCVELLLDLLPLRQCFLFRELTPSPVLPRAIERMQAMLRHMQLGDGALARFNGASAIDRDALATVLAYDKGRETLDAVAPYSGYARMERGTTVVIADAAGPPPQAHAEAAHAGCLSFEMSAGRELLFVNCAAPRTGDASLRAAMRATASHNTLCISEQSSSKLVRRGHPRTSPAIQHPDRVTCRIAGAGGGVSLETSHDGYAGRWGLLHRRVLTLDAGGTVLEGTDSLTPVKGGVLRFAWDQPFAIHFHVHADAEVRPGQTPDAADIVLPSGAHWRLSASGAALSIEAGVHCAGALGPQPALQVVLRAVCPGEAAVTWRVELMPPGSLAGLSEAHGTAAPKSLAGKLAEIGAGPASGDAAEPDPPAFKDR